MKSDHIKRLTLYFAEIWRNWITFWISKYYWHKVPGASFVNVLLQFCLSSKFSFFSLFSLKKIWEFFWIVSFEKEEFVSREIFVGFEIKWGKHGRPQGRARGGSCPPPGRPRPAKNSMFFDFFGKNSIFFVVF